MRDRLRALLPRLHVLPALTRTVVAIGAQALAEAIAAAGEDDDVIVVDPGAETLGRLRENVREPNVCFLLGDTEVLPLPDASVDALVGESAERERVLR